MFGKIDKEFKEIIIKTVKDIKEKQDKIELDIQKFYKDDTIFECMIKAKVPLDNDIEKKKYENFMKELETLMRSYGYLRVTATFIKKI